MELPYDILLILCDTLEDSRCLFLTCKWLYHGCTDKIYWQAQGGEKLAVWLPKIKTKHSFDDFILHGNLLMVKYFVSHGADITANNNLAVQLASCNGRLELVKYLVSIGAMSK